MFRFYEMIPNDVTYPYSADKLLDTENYHKRVAYFANLIKLKVEVLYVCYIIDNIEFLSYKSELAYFRKYTTIIVSDISDCLRIKITRYQ